MPNKPLNLNGVLRKMPFYVKGSDVHRLGTGDSNIQIAVRESMATTIIHERNYPAGSPFRPNCTWSLRL